MDKLKHKARSPALILAEWIFSEICSVNPSELSPSKVLDSLVAWKERPQPGNRMSIREFLQSKNITAKISIPRPETIKLKIKVRDRANQWKHHVWDKARISRLIYDWRHPEKKIPKGRRQ